MPTLEPTPFTSEAEIDNLLSTLGVDLRVAEPPTAAIVPYYVSLGTTEVLFYTSRAGSAVDLAATPFIRHHATIYAAMALTGHGGEPMNSTLVTLWEQAKAKLELILQQKADVPGLINTGMVPGQGVAVTNTQIDMQRMPPVRRVRGASTDKPEGYRSPPHYPTQGWPIT
jgi:hypothetical protein